MSQQAIRELARQVALEDGMIHAPVDVAEDDLLEACRKLIHVARRANLRLLWFILDTQKYHRVIREASPGSAEHYVHDVAQPPGLIELYGVKVAEYHGEPMLALVVIP